MMRILISLPTPPPPESVHLCSVVPEATACKRDQCYLLPSMYVRVDFMQPW